MKKELVAWLILTICCAVLSNYASESAVTPQSKPFMRTQVAKSAHNGLIRESNREHTTQAEGIDRVRVKSFERAGKGVYGGGNLMHPRTTPAKSQAHSSFSNLLHPLLSIMVGLLFAVLVYH